MFRRLNPLLVRLSRWPRRLAALGCLVLAAASALIPAGGSPPTHSDSDPTAGRLRDGQVAVPLAADAGELVRTGSRVGVYGSADEDVGPALVADHLLVLAITPADELAGDAPTLVVAADRTEAGRLAAVAGAPILVVLDGGP